MVDTETEQIVVETRINKILRTRLKGKNLSALARQLGVRKTLLADWVSARRVPSLRNIEAIAKIAAYLNLSLEELLLKDDDQRKVISSATFEEEDREYRIHIERLK